jgi:hypothetical protein
MTSGRHTSTLNREIREWVIKELGQHPEGLSVRQLQQRMPPECHYSAKNLRTICAELSEWHGYKDRGWGKRLFVARWGPRRNAEGRVLSGGRPEPIFKLGFAPNAERPDLTLNAMRKRAENLRIRNALRLEKEKAALKLRRELKRKPKTDPLMAAFFTKPPTRLS